jgi:hypothetical protein
LATSTDPELPVEQVVQFYLWCWDIEVNFREDETLLRRGAGGGLQRPIFASRCPPFKFKIGS